MKVSVFGLGYVGAVSCGCFAHDGFDVIGVDVNPAKVASINDGRAPIVEERIGDIVAEAVAAGRLRATTDVEAAVLATDVSVISVGTPSRTNGSLDLTAVVRVSEQIGAALARKTTPHTVVVRSTVLPGTVRNHVIPALETCSGRVLGDGLSVCFNPEFLREGSSVRDHYDPPFTLIGHGGESDPAPVAALYGHSAGETFFTSIETAEMVKYVCNAFHALKVTFANEVGLVAQALGVDSHQVMALVCKDTKLNISARYLRPGFAFGGSCLPKDLRALTNAAREHDVEVRTLSAILASNRYQIERAVDAVRRTKKRNIGILGITFKAGTDDLRESPLVELTEALIGKGLNVRIYDSQVSLARLTGANKQYIEWEIPHISSLLSTDLDAVIQASDVIVVGNNAPEFTDVWRKCMPEQFLLDLAGVERPPSGSGIVYQGVTW